MIPSPARVQQALELGCALGQGYPGPQGSRALPEFRAEIEVGPDHARERIFDHLTGLLDWLGCSIDIRSATLNPTVWMPATEVPDARLFGGAGYRMIYRRRSFRGELKM